MTKFQLKAAPLPKHFRGTPQEFLDALADRLEIRSDASAFSPSATQPVGNEGPWINANGELLVWDETLSTYTPLDMSESYTPPFWVGTTAPTDTEKYQLWVKVSSTALLGLYYWNGTDWITQVSGIADNSLSTIYFATGAVTTRKIRNGAVKEENLSGNIPLNKWSPGGARYFARSRSDAASPEWRKVQYMVEFVIPSGATGQITHTHGLGVLPHEVQISAVHDAPAVTPDHISADLAQYDEYILDSNHPAIVVTDEVISFCAAAFFNMANLDGTLRLPESGHWKYRLYYTAP